MDSSSRLAPEKGLDPRNAGAAAVPWEAPSGLGWLLQSTALVPEKVSPDVKALA